MTTEKDNRPSEKIKLERVIASYPNLTPDRADEFGRLTCDLLFDKSSKEHMAQLDALKKKIHKVKVAAYGADKEEWPDEIRKSKIKDGDEREDQPTYHDRFCVTVATGVQHGVDAIDTSGKPYDVSKIRGGMLVDVIVRIAPWTHKNKKGTVLKEGVSLYLQGFMIDPKRETMPGFGGKPNLASEFGVNEDMRDEEEEGDEAPPSKKASKGKAKKNFSDDEEE